MMREEIDIMQEKHYVETPKFTGRNVPIDEIAKATGKSATFLREALKLGIMHFGYAFKKDGAKNYTFYCPDKQVWEELGYFKEE
jgi:hypothetical protein